MRRFVAVAGVAVITSLLPSPIARGSVPGPVAGQGAPDGDAGPDADVVRILGPQGTPVRAEPDAGRPAPPASRPAAIEPPASSPTGKPAPTGTRPSSSRPVLASGKPGDGGQLPATKPSASKPVDAEPAGAKPAAKPAGDKSHDGPAQADHRPAGTKSGQSRPAKTRHRHEWPLVVGDPDSGFVVLYDLGDTDVHHPFGPGDLHLPSGACHSAVECSGSLPAVPLPGWRWVSEDPAW